MIRRSLQFAAVASGIALLSACPIGPSGDKVPSSLLTLIISPNTKTLNIGEVFRFECRANSLKDPAWAVWRSDNEEVATVHTGGSSGGDPTHSEAWGDVTGVDAGEAKITCDAGDTEVSAVVTVLPKPATVTCTPSVIFVGGTSACKFTDDKGEVPSSITIWKATPAGTGQISASGVVTGGPGTGSLAITANAPRNAALGVPKTLAGSATVTVIPTPAVSATMMCSGFGLPLPGTGSLGCGVFSADGAAATNVTFAVVSGPGSFTGSVLRADAGATAGSQVVASGTGTINGATATGTITLTIGATQTATSATLAFASGSTPTVRVGQKHRLLCSAANASGPLTIYSPIFSVQMSSPGPTPPPIPFSIDSYGWLTATATGTATAQCFVNGVRGAFDLTVVP